MANARLADAEPLQGSWNHKHGYWPLRSRLHDDEKNINPSNRDRFIEFEIYNFKNDIIKGKVRDSWDLEEIINSQKKKDKYQTAIEHHGKLINVDLNSRKVAIWNPTQDKETIKLDISCKLYKGSDDSILRSILKMIN